jgi:hypothetical protein
MQDADTAAKFHEVGLKTRQAAALSRWLGEGRERVNTASSSLGNGGKDIFLSITPKAPRPFQFADEVDHGLLHFALGDFADATRDGTDNRRNSAFRASIVRRLKWKWGQFLALKSLQRSTACTLFCSHGWYDS